MAWEERRKKRDAMLMIGGRLSVPASEIVAMELRKGFIGIA